MEYASSFAIFTALRHSDQADERRRQELRAGDLSGRMVRREHQNEMLHRDRVAVEFAVQTEVSLTILSY
jgi:hypothetical protein